MRTEVALCLSVHVDSFPGVDLAGRCHLHYPSDVFVVAAHGVGASDVGEWRDDDVLRLDHGDETQRGAVAVHNFLLSLMEVGWLVTWR